MIHISMLIDESGSMSPPRGDVVETYNKYIKEVKKENKKTDAMAYLFFFDDRGDKKILRKKRESKLQDVKPLVIADYFPKGMTPLNDAVIQAINAISKNVKKKDKVLFVIYTDGYENASESTTTDVRKLVNKKQKENWTFIYLGANQDAWTVSHQYGMQQRGQTFSTVNTGKGLRSTSSVLASATNDYASVGDGGTLQEAEDALRRVTAKHGTKIEEGSEEEKSKKS